MENENAQQNFAIFNDEIVWYGSTNFMFYFYKKGAMLRLVHQALAIELKQQFSPTI